MVEHHEISRYECPEEGPITVVCQCGWRGEGWTVGDAYDLFLDHRDKPRRP